MILLIYFLFLFVISPESKNQVGLSLEVILKSCVMWDSTEERFQRIFTSCKKQLVPFVLGLV